MLRILSVIAVLSVTACGPDCPPSEPEPVDAGIPLAPEYGAACVTPGETFCTRGGQLLRCDGSWVIVFGRGCKATP